MKGFVSWRLLMLSLFMMAVAQPLLAAEKDVARQIVAVEVSGNRYVDSEAILAQVDSKPGTVVSRRTISRDVRRLFKSGNYEDIRVVGIPEQGGIRLRFVVKENPLIADFKVEGNSEFTYKDMKRKLKLKPGEIFSKNKLRSDRNVIRKGYLKKGYYQVEVTPKITKLPDGRINLILHIEEGDVTRIRDIRFVGNTVFTDDELRAKIHSQSKSLMNWFGDRDVLNSQRFGGDVQALEQFYQDHGYLDAKVESGLSSLTPDKGGFYLTFSLHEGPAYTVSGIRLQGDLVPSEEKLRQAVSLQEGELYSLSELRKSIEDMTLLVGDEGYAFASVTPLFKRNLNDNSVEVVFDIEKGREVYVERINVSGNAKTDDSVIRRELRQDEMARFTATGVKRTRERLGRSELFKDVRVSLPKGSASDRVKMNVDVTEDKTGNFAIGGGYSQLEKVLITTRITEKNFLGKGYGVNAKAEVGAKTQNFNFSFTDPNFMDSDVRASINAQKSQTKPLTVVQYKQNNISGGVNFDFPLSEELTYSLGYQYSRTNLSNFAANSSLLLLAQQGVHTTGEVSQALSYDSRDKTVGASDGYYHVLRLSAAGLAGQDRFYEAELKTSKYIPLGDDSNLRLALGGAAIGGYSGKKVPIYRRYSLGGIGSLRGFDYYGVSIRDPQTKDPVGGDKKLTASVDLFLPIPYMQTTGVRAVLFADAGTMWGNVNATVAGRNIQLQEPFSAANIRSSVGFGLEWLSPVGPVTLSWANAVRKKPSDLLRSFEFSLGSMF
jgi:outer membrane protein insertion porin family